MSTHEVWARAAMAAVDLGREIDPTLAGIPIAVDELQRKKRVPWTEYTAVLDWLRDAAGGWDELEDVIAGSYHAMVPELRAVAAALISPRAFFRLVLDVLDPLLFPPLEFRYEDLGDSRVRVAIHTRPGVAPSETFFRGNLGAFRGLPQHLNLPRAEIVAADIAPDHGIYEVRLPEARTIVHRARGAVLRFVLGTEPDGTPVMASLGTPDVDPLAARLDDATSAWKLTPRQRDVLALIAAGKANKEIANELACADNTVELHVTRVLRKAGVTSRTQLIARFWSETWGSPQ